MEEMVEFQSQPLGVVDHPAARPIRIGEGEIVFDRVTFRYGAHAEPLLRDFSLRINAGERWSRGPLRLRQDHLRQAASPPLRRYRRPHSDRRRGHRASRAGFVALATRPRTPGADTLPPFAGGKHRLRASQGRFGAGRGGRATGQRARVHREAAQGLRHAGGRTRRQALRRRTSR